MSFKVRMNLDGKQYNVLSVKYGLSQETDATGRPSSIVRGGKITVSVESTGDSALFEKVSSNYDRVDGEIVFLKRDTDAALKTLKFSEAYVVSYEETFSGGGLTSGVASAAENEATMETIVFSAREINMGNGTHTNEWV